jgi:UDP-glucose:(heptosyl)LPS alpha-1,3-glucosyltransferase
MRIAFGIVSLFPGGGLQRDCMEIARLIREQGHSVIIHTCRLQDHQLGSDTPVVVLQNSARTNHHRQYTFAIDFLEETANKYDLVVGFDKLMALDVLYCADASMAYRMFQQPYLRLLPRYRSYWDLEKCSFSADSSTRIIFLSDNQIIEYQSAWFTTGHRMTVVPPTVAPARRRPEWRSGDIRPRMRAELGLGPYNWVWLSIGVQPETKGIDRAIEALTKFPDATLLIAGLTDTNHASTKLAKLARRLDVASRIKWLGHREDIHGLMAAADLLVHPARYDTTGTVILEAIVNGLPVITTAACGYARHVEAAQAGKVIKEPFEFPLFVAAINRGREFAVRQAWSLAGQKYGRDPELYQGRSRAAEIIVRTGLMKLASADQQNGTVPTSLPTKRTVSRMM